MQILNICWVIEMNKCIYTYLKLCPLNELFSDWPELVSSSSLYLIMNNNSNNNSKVLAIDWALSLSNLSNLALKILWEGVIFYKGEN